MKEKPFNKHNQATLPSKFIDSQTPTKTNPKKQPQTPNDLQPQNQTNPNRKPKPKVKAKQTNQTRATSNPSESKTKEPKPHPNPNHSPTKQTQKKQSQTQRALWTKAFPQNNQIKLTIKPPRLNPKERTHLFLLPGLKLFGSQEPPAVLLVVGLSARKATAKRWSG